MAEIVLGYSSAHAPMMSADPASAPGEMSARFFTALQYVREKSEAVGAEAVVMVSGEHFTNFFLDNMPQISIGVGATHLGPVEKWLGIDRVVVPGAPELAQAVLAGTLARGHLPAFANDLVVDHGFMTVYHALNPGATLPLVPVIMNCTTVPLMTLRHCWEFGVALGQAIRGFDGLDRVLLVGAGGVSHFVGEPRVGDIDQDFDLWFLRMLEQGCPPELLGIGNDELMLAGNGTGEVRAWVTVAGAMSADAGAGDVTTTSIDYEPIHEWINGMAVTVHEPAAARAVGPRTPPSIFAPGQRYAAGGVA